MALNRKLTVPALVAMSISGAACGSTQSTDKVTLPNGAQVTNVKKAVEDAKNRAAAASHAVGAGEQSGGGRGNRAAERLHHSVRREARDDHG